MSQRSNIVRRERRQRPTYIAAGGALLAMVSVVVIAVSVRSPSGIPTRDYRHLSVQVPDPGNLVAHDPVRIAGIRIGQVTGVEAGTGAAEGQSLIRLKLNPGTEQFAADTKVVVRAMGLLGARYVEVIPGRGGQPMAWGSVIRAGRGSVTYGVTDLLDTFDARTRNGMDAMIDGYGRGLIGRGQGLNDVIRVVPGGERDFQALAAEIFRRPGALRRLVPSLRQAAVAFDTAREDVARMLEPTAKGLQPFVDERAGVRETLAAAPSALAGLQSGMERGQQLLRAARELSTAAARVLPAAPAGLRATRRLLVTSAVPLERTTRLLAAVKPAVPSVLRITEALSPNLGMLRRGFDDADALASAISPFNCDLENGAHSFRSLIGYPVGPSTDGGTTGPWTGFRAFVVGGGPELTGSLTPTAGDTKGVSAEPYPPACKYSPGGEYKLGRLVTPYAKAGAR